MRKGRTIGGAGLLGMVAVSWISILVIGGTWLYSMYADFQADADRIREERYAERRSLVKGEVDDAIELIARLRRSAADTLGRRLDSRMRDVRALNEVLARDLAKGTDGTVLRIATVRLMAALDRSEARLYAIRDNTIYLFSPFPKWVDREDALTQVEAELEGVTNGQRRLDLKVADGMNGYTLLVKVNEFGAHGLRVVAGACLEMAEETVKETALRQLADIRYAKNGSLFGGTMEGVSILGPVPGRNMWAVTDANGVKIVQELIAAAKRGGEFVNYVMPPLSGERNEPKVSYARLVPDWGWYIGTGAFVGDIEGVVELKRKQLEQHIQDRGLLILSGMAALSLLALYLSRRLARNIENNVASFTTVWKRAASGRGEIDVASLDYAEFKTLAEAANHMVAERQTAQEALSESLERFSSLVANVPGIIYHSDFRGVWVNRYISDTVLDVTGYPAEDFMEGGGRTFQSIIHPEDREWVAQSLRQGLEHRQTYLADYRIIRRDGEIRWVSERGRILHDEQGGPERLDGVVFDVTDRKHAEEEYYNHIHFLETLDRIDRAMHVGTSTREMLGTTVEAIRVAFGADRAWLLKPCDPEADEFRVVVNETSPEFVVEEEVVLAVDDNIRRDMRMLLDSPVPLAFDPFSGRTVPREITDRYDIRSQLMFAIRPRVGPALVLGLHHCREPRVWTSEEIRLFTEAGRRLADGLNVALILDELTESEERFRTFSEQTMLGLCVLQENRVIFINRAAADIVEAPVEELMALPPGGFVRYLHPDDSDFVVEQARRKQAGEADTVSAYSWRAVTGTGRVKWVEIHSRTTRVNGKSADLVSLVDITALKRAEEDLEAIIAERTSALALKAEELKRANTELTRLDDLKSSFLTTVSHTMRTPLTSVLGYGALARKELDRALGGAGNSESLHRALGNLDVLEAEGRRLNLLVEQFMELADMEAGGDLRTEATYPVAATIRRAVEDARAECIGRDRLEVTLDMEENLPELNVLPEHLERVLGHLLGNACHFTRDGKISVRVASPDGKGLELTVADTGKGIPEEELEAIFKPFHQVDTGDTLVDEIKGAGLGLALCRMVVEKLGGRVWARSEGGRGAVFHVILPGGRD
ncbi:multi-sensor signal transduction histidine kinase [Pseudodesulfovibrio mercurii]|uniref:histidine kinase n=1 Tax=Pseudodesulfovibrio mercurii TaxID=641491 RepID=F0JKB1_9BACT|nr:cache domain-containing protein [Pseudodesulfovibrio mercurii]EGB16360.1 multi-sensor signal transduction histidine kinase [Pseudodesulfovibrio mercurii]